MKGFLTILAFIIISGHAIAQTQCEPLNMALKQPAYCEGVILNPGETRKIKKFIRRIERFDNLNTVYIEKGFTSEQLQDVMVGLNNIDLDEIIVECDTLKDLVSILAGLHRVSKITLKEPFVMKPDCLNDIKKLNCKALGLHSSTRISVPRDFSFPKQLEEIEILSKQPAKNHLLVNKLVGLEKLEAVYISTAGIASLPQGLGAITNLKTLEIINANEIDKEDDLMAQKFRMAKQAHECSRLVSITYNTSAAMEENEKQLLTNVFSGYYFIQEKNQPLKSEPANATEVATAETFSQLVGFTPMASQLDVKRKVFSVPAETPVKIEVNSGTAIYIPQNAFVDANGNPVEGNVQVTYREIKTPLDMLMSGVPMAYDSGGVTNQFVSAGNFEILAFANGQPVNLAEGKEIDIDFASTDKNTGYNLYKLDAETQNWEYLDNADEKSQPRRDTGTVETTVVKDNDFEYGFDTTLFEERFASMDYRYALDPGETQGYVMEMGQRKNRVFLFNHSKRVNTKWGLLKVTINPADKAKSDSVHQLKFTLVPKISKKNKAVYFPELISFRGYTFYTLHQTTCKEFRDSYIKRQKYNDVRILYEEGSDYCTIQLKNNNQIIEVTADITQGETGLRAKYRKLSFARKYKKYSKSLDKRIARLNGGLEYRKLTARNNFYFRAKNDNGTVNPAYQFSYEISRKLNIKGLGVYNCDAFFKYPTPPSVLTNVTLKTADSGTVTPFTVYVVDSRLNGLLTYSPTSVSLYKKHTKTIVAIDTNRNVYCIDKPAGEAIDENTISVKRIDPELMKNRREFAKQVGL